MKRSFICTRIKILISFEQHEQAFKINPFDVQFTLKQLFQLKTNKAIGLDRISAPLLKDSASVIADS